ncbi:MAG: WecB/TagA/CpsF family glycosyltransferase [Leptolyngbya sp. SIO3F4]|nr:WecB/TagA/CpsF family glycosyltransferase [Leptolyngbya sp. SIO3F4]
MNEQLILSIRYFFTERIEQRLYQNFPKLKIAGIESPPFRPMTKMEDKALVERINQSGASFTFVSLGCPKQECWMQAHKGQVNSVMVGVGGVFPIYAGLKRRAPAWVRQHGLEWLYRLLQEPRRLFGRYIKTIPLFIFLVLFRE